MKYIMLAIISLFFFSNSLHSQMGVNISDKIAEYDSLLMEVDTTQLSYVLQNDSLAPSIISGIATPTDWDSIKATYLDVIIRIGRKLEQEDEEKKRTVETALELEERYQARYAGNQAPTAFEKLKNTYSRDEINKAVIYHIIADFFRVNHINNEKNRLLDNADMMEYFLKMGEIHIDSARQDRALDGGFSDIDEAGRLLNLYHKEDQESPAFRSLSKELKKRYDAYERKLREERYFRVKEETTEFKEIGFTIGVGAGGNFSIQEPFPKYFYSDPTSGNRFLDEETQDIKSFLGYAVSFNISYYVSDNFSVELSYLYSKIERERPKYFPYRDNPFFLPVFPHPITYSTINCVGTYLFRVKTGIRTLTGLGLSYTKSEAPASQIIGHYHIYPNYVTFTSFPQKSDRIRAIVRGGVEYLPGRESQLSYSLIIDCSINISSHKDISPLLILRDIVNSCVNIKQQSLV